MTVGKTNQTYFISLWDFRNRTVPRLFFCGQVFGCSEDGSGADFLVAAINEHVALGDDAPAERESDPLLPRRFEVSLELNLDAVLWQGWRLLEVFVHLITVSASFDL